MDKIVVTQADIDAADKAFYIAFGGNTDGIDDTMRELLAHHRIESQRPLLEALDAVIRLIPCVDISVKGVHEHKEVRTARKAIKQAKGGLL